MVETLPSCPVSIRIDQRRAQQATESPFTFKTKVISAPGAMWTAAITLPKMGPALAAKWRGFFARLNGMEGAFYLSDTAAKVPQGTARGTGTLTGNPRDTTVQTVFSGTLLSGDYISCNDHLYILLDDVTNGGPARIWPPLRDTGGPLLLENARGTFRLADPSNGYDVEMARVYQFSFEAIEVL